MRLWKIVGNRLHRYRHLKWPRPHLWSDERTSLLVTSKPEATSRLKSQLQTPPSRISSRISNSLMKTVFGLKAVKALSCGKNHHTDTPGKFTNAVQKENGLPGWQWSDPGSRKQNNEPESRFNHVQNTLMFRVKEFSNTKHTISVIKVTSSVTSSILPRHHGAFDLHQLLSAWTLAGGSLRSHVHQTTYEARKLQNHSDSPCSVYRWFINCPECTWECLV